VAKRFGPVRLGGYILKALENEPDAVPVSGYLAIGEPEGSQVIYLMLIGALGTQKTILIARKFKDSFTQLCDECARVLRADPRALRVVRNLYAANRKLAITNPGAFVAILQNLVPGEWRRSVRAAS